MLLVLCDQRRRTLDNVTGFSHVGFTLARTLQLFVDFFICRIDLGSLTSKQAASLVWFLPPNVLRQIRR